MSIASVSSIYYNSRLNLLKGPKAHFWAYSPGRRMSSSGYSSNT